MLPLLGGLLLGALFGGIQVAVTQDMADKQKAQAEKDLANQKQHNNVNNLRLSNAGRQQINNGILLSLQERFEANNKAKAERRYQGEPAEKA